MKEAVQRVLLSMGICLFATSAFSEPPSVTDGCMNGTKCATKDFDLESAVAAQNANIKSASKVDGRSSATVPAWSSAFDTHSVPGGTSVDKWRAEIDRRDQPRSAGLPMQPVTQR
ncbi:hypothetical protein [Burkholderia alba]|uniref:hypothetical protein n=1 Tax=Burkholderia alba TaxID=2683677 RepID=UPI002B055A6B|nr:hypothetical protein [Burkholderia alba]